MRAFVLSLALAWSLTARPATALTWPTATGQVDADLRSSDVEARRRGAAALGQLGPARARPLVLAALADSDTDVRVRAARAATRLGLSEAVDVVGGWLAERDPRLKLAACDVLRRFPSARLVPVLARALVDSDPDVRTAAADALGATRAPDAVAPLATRLDDSTPSVREATARALAAVGDPRGVVPLLGKMQDTSPEVRRAVARALGRLRDPRSVQALLLGVRDSVAPVRSESLRALGRIASAPTADAIAPLTRDRVAEVRSAACDALARIASPRAIEALIVALGASVDDVAPGLDETPPRRALRLVGPAATKQLVATLEHPRSAAEAGGAAWVLGALHATAHEEDVTRAMARGALDATAGLHALAGLGTARSLPLVLEHLADTRGDARREARRAARALLDPTRPDGRAVEPLLAALGSASTADERAELVALLGRTGAPRAAGALVPLFQDRSPVVRTAALDAAGHLGTDNESVAHLLELLRDGDGATRRQAATALAEAGGSRTRDTLIAWLTTRPEIDRHAVLIALGPVLTRAPSAPGARALVRMLSLSAGGDRDAILAALGGTDAALELAAGPAPRLDDVDRRTLASALGASVHGAPQLTRWLSDSDAAVRAEAAWALGSIGGAGALAALSRVASQKDLAPAVNATAALGRISARSGAREATASLCLLATDARPYVRANARSALALLRARCGDGARDRAALGADPDPTARLAAARHVLSAPASADEQVLIDCADHEPNAAIAALCDSRSAPPATSDAAPGRAEIYVVGPGSSSPEPLVPYALSYGDGLIRVGRTDRRGAFLEPRARIEGAQLVAQPLPGPALTTR